MTTSIEQRITQMRFDNGQFEKAVSTTLGTLDKLKSKLNFKDAATSFGDIGKAAKNVSFEGMSSSVDGLSLKFSSLGVIGVTALSNITNKAIEAGKRMVESLSTDQISAGFGEYETKINSIQTILANTTRYGTTVADINKSLEALNAYSDKTIYNYGQMTQAAGLFTNAGLRMEDSISMIQGFSNVAAASGTNAQAAAQAARQLAQGLNTGIIKAQDWISLTSAQMGNKNMTDGLIQIATAMGKFKGQSDVATLANKDFRGSLEKGWLTADVMSTYLKIMTNDQNQFSDAQMKALGLNDDQITSLRKQSEMAEKSAVEVRTFTQLIGALREAIGSGWAKTFELLIGDFTSATARFTAINEILTPMLTASGDARNALLKSWVDAGGQNAVLSVIGNGFTSLIKIFGAVSKAFAVVFPPPSVEILTKLAQGIQKFADSLVVSDKTLNNIQGAFQIFFGSLKFLSDLMRFLLTVVTRPFELMRAAMFDTLGKIPSLAKGAEDAINGFLSVFGLQFVGFDKLGDSILSFFRIFDTINVDELLQVPPIFKEIEAGAQNLASKAGVELAKVFSFDNMANLARKSIEVWNSFVGIIQSIDALFGRTKDTFVNWFGGFASGLLNGVKGIGEALAKVGELIRTYIINMNKGVSGAFDSVAGEQVVTGILSALNIGMVIAIARKLKSVFTTLGDLKKGMTKALDGLTGVFKNMQNNLKANLLLTIAAAILVLAVAIAVLAQVDPNRLTTASVGIATAMATLSVGLLVLDKLSINDTGLIKIGLALIFFATAVVILAKAIQLLGGMSWESLAKGLGSVFVVMLLIIGLAKVLSSMKKSMVEAGVGLIIFAGAMYLLAGAVSLFGLIPMDVLVQGMVTLGLITLAMIAFINAVPPAKAYAAAVGVLAIATALGMLVPSIIALGLVPWQVLLQGGIALIVLLGALSLAMMLTQKAAPGAAALVAVAFALGILVTVITALGLLPVDVIVQGIGAMAAALIILAISMQLMNGAVVGAAALLAIAVSMMILAVAVVMLGSAGLEIVGVGLLALAGVMIIFGVAALALSAALPAMLGMSSAILMLGVAVLAAGAGMVLFSLALMIFGPAAAIAAAGVVALGMAAASLGEQALAILAVGAAFVVLGAGLMIVAAAILILGLGLSLVGVGLALIGVSAAIGVSGLIILIEALRGMILDIPMILGIGGALAVLGAGMILTGAGALAMGIGALVLAVGLLALIGVTAIMLNLVQPLSDGISRLAANGPQMDAFATSAGNMATAMGSMASSIDASSSSMQNAASVFGMVATSITGVADTFGYLPGTVANSMTSVTTTMSSGSTQIQASIIAMGLSLALMKTNFDQSVIDTDAAMKSLATSITSNSSIIVAAVYSMSSSLDSALASAASSASSEAVKIGVAVNDGIVRGLNDNARVTAAARSVAAAALKAANAELGIASPSKEFTNTGKFSVLGIVQGWLNNESLLTSTVKDVAGGMILTMKNSLNGISSDLGALIDANPVITPVIDLDAAAKDAKSLNSMLGSSLNVKSPKLAASAVASTVNSGNSQSDQQAVKSSSTPTISLTQINNSPTALSRLEIYRQTNNQLKTLQGVLSNK